MLKMQEVKELFFAALIRNMKNQTYFLMAGLVSALNYLQLSWQSYVTYNNQNPCKITQQSDKERCANWMR